MSSMNATRMKISMAWDRLLPRESRHTDLHRIPEEFDGILQLDRCWMSTGTAHLARTVSRARVWILNLAHCEDRQWVETTDDWRGANLQHLHRFDRRNGYAIQQESSYPRGFFINTVQWWMARQLTRRRIAHSVNHSIDRRWWINGRRDTKEISE